jgi:hypothetical protein
MFMNILFFVILVLLLVFLKVDTALLTSVKHKFGTMLMFINDLTGLALLVIYSLL